MSDKEDFIANLYPAATRVSRETGMSRELILAQAAQETGWGAHVLPGTNNIFNIKAQGNWNGPTKTFNVWEIENGKKVCKDQEFRVYESVEDALRDRVKFLNENPRYADAGLFDEGVKGNLEKEAEALQKAGYATDPNYARQLVAVYNSPTMRRAIQQAETIDTHPHSHSMHQLHQSEIRHESGGDVRVLKQGDHGDAVRKLQADLARLGYTDAQNHALRVDADFGPATRGAMEAFQRDHHLTVDGKAGPRTLAAIRAQGQAPVAPGLDHALHPDHVLYEQALRGMMKIDADMGRASDQHTTRLAAALTVAAKAQGLSQIDTVALSEDGSRTFAVQDTSPFRTLASVSIAQGTWTPIAQSSHAWLQPAQKAAGDASFMPQRNTLQDEQIQARPQTSGAPGM